MDEAVVPDDVAFDDCAVLGEELSHLRRLRVVREIADEDLRRGSVRSFATLRGLTLDRLPMDHMSVQILYRVPPCLLVLHMLCGDNNTCDSR